MTFGPTLIISGSISLPFGFFSTFPYGTLHYRHLISFRHGKPIPIRPQRYNLDVFPILLRMPRSFHSSLLRSSLIGLRFHYLDISVHGVNYLSFHFRNWTICPFGLKPP